MRDEKTKKAFVEYLQDPKNKDLRFWQAIRNFSRYDFVLGWESDEFDFDKLPKGCVDTFYIESDSNKSDTEND